MSSGHPSTVIFIEPPSLEVLRARLEHRGTENKEKVDLRVETAKKEIEKARTGGFITKTLVNDSFEDFFRATVDYLRQVYPYSII